MFKVEVNFIFSMGNPFSREYENAQAALDAIRCICEENTCKTGRIECAFSVGFPLTDEWEVVTEARINVTTVNERAAVNNILPFESRWDEDFQRSLLYMRECFNDFMSGLRFNLDNIKD